MDLNICLTAVFVASIASDSGHLLRVSSTPVLLISSNRPASRPLPRSPKAQDSHDWTGQSPSDHRLETNPGHRQTDSLDVVRAWGSSRVHSATTYDPNSQSENRIQSKHSKSHTFADRSGNLFPHWNVQHAVNKRHAEFRPEDRRQVGDGMIWPAGFIVKRSGGTEAGSSINRGSGVLPSDPRGEQQSRGRQERTEESEAQAQPERFHTGREVNEGGEEGGVQGLQRRRDTGDADVAEPALVHNEHREDREGDGRGSSEERRPFTLRSTVNVPTSARPHSRTTVLSDDASAVANDLPPVLNHPVRSLEATASPTASPVIMTAGESGHDATRATTRRRLTEEMGTAAPPVLQEVETPRPSSSASRNLIAGTAADASSLTTPPRHDQGLHDHTSGGSRGPEGKAYAVAEGNISRPLMPYNPVVRPSAALTSVSHTTLPTATTPEMIPANAPFQNRSVQVDHPPGLDLNPTLSPMSTRLPPAQTVLPAITTSAAHNISRNQDTEVSEVIRARPSMRPSTAGSRDGYRDGESNNASSLTTAAAQPFHGNEPAVSRSVSPTIDRLAVIPLHDHNTTLLVPTLSVSTTSLQQTAATAVHRDTTLSVTSTVPRRTISSFLPNSTANAQRAPFNNTELNTSSPGTTSRYATTKLVEKTEQEAQSVSNTTASVNTNLTPTTVQPAVASTFGPRTTAFPAIGSYSARSPETPRVSVSHFLTSLLYTPTALPQNTTALAVVDGGLEDGKKSSEGTDHRHILVTTLRTTKGEGFSPLPSTTSPVRTSSCTQTADVSPDIHLTGPLYIEIKLQMTWREFCSNLNIFRLELVDIVRQSTQQESFAVDQICLLESPRKACALRTSGSGPSLEIFEEEQIEIQLYLVNKTRHYDVMLTYNCAKTLKQGFQALETSMFKDKLILVRLQELTEQDPPETPSPSTASGESMGDYSFLNVPGVTIVISIASVGGVCCAALIVIQIVLRRRYREGVRALNRNYSVASADSIALNSVTKSRPNSGLFNPGLDIAPEKPAKPVSHLLNFTQLTRFVSDLAAIYGEFQRIPNKTPRLSVVPVGAEDRNRFANILPIPSTRVVLNTKDAQDNVATYINANYVSGYNGRQRTYIATQAPLEKTMADFWLMVWQHEIKAVVMLLNPVEDGQKKCGMYFPESAGQEYTVTCGDFVVTMTKRDVHQEYITSWLQLKMIKTRETRTVRHFWLTCWPLGGRPDPISLVRFVLDTRPMYEDYIVPLLVHCSNGTARTGTFIALDICMRQFEDRRTADVMSCVDVLRHERAGCVQTSEQYVILYQAVNEYAKILSSPGLSATSSAVTLAPGAETVAPGAETVAPS